MATSIHKPFLEYLYIQWIAEDNLPFSQVNHRAFRQFLQYVNPPANALLPSSPTTIKAHAQDLYEEGKKRLRILINSALSEIHISCDI